MKNIKVVIGSNFGDEGKGLMTDYFCSKFPENKPVLNVRFNGGAQAGHTVIAPDGRRHVFGHFGAGSFNPNVATYLGPDFIVNPILFKKEYDKLMALGVYPMVFVHPRCLLTMPQDMMVNQFIEMRRGTTRHGSCGVGVYETILRSKVARPIHVKDMKYAEPRFQIDIGYYNDERIQKIFGFKLANEEMKLLSNQNIKAHFDQDLKFFMDHVSVTDETIFDKYDNIVFEGAQGLMLDQNNIDYFPHLTPSNTGIQNVLKYFSNEDNESVEVCYVTRTYLTRHGAGKLPNECTMAEAGAKVDLTNHENEWQGSLRYGKLDISKVNNRTIKDFMKVGEFCLTLPCDVERTIALTHSDCEENFKRIFYDAMEERKNGEIPIHYTSVGPFRHNVYDYGSLFYDLITERRFKPYGTNN